MLELFFYLAFFFGALRSTTYSCCGSATSTSLWSIGFAVINAALITKVIMIGEYAKLGKQYENKAILISAGVESFHFWLAGVCVPRVGGSHQAADSWSRLFEVLY
jgi:hypothetical protein